MAKFVLSAFADEAGSSVFEQINALLANDIGYIEPRNIDGKNILTLSDDELNAFKSELDKNGIKVNSLGSPIGKYPIDKPFEDHLADFDKALKVAKLLETKNMRIFSFYVDQSSLEKYEDEVISRMKRLLEIAADTGIRLCHENESRIFGQMPREVNKLLSDIPSLYGIFDAANYRMNDADVMEGIRATLINLAYIHIKDAIYKEQMIVPAGEGEGHLDEILEIVNSATDGVVYLTLEPHLHIFDAYKDIDEHELKGKYTFKTNREAFDFAANALKALLTKLGYKRNQNNEWVK